MIWLASTLMLLALLFDRLGARALREAIIYQPEYRWPFRARYIVCTAFEWLFAAGAVAAAIVEVYRATA